MEQGDHDGDAGSLVRDLAERHRAIDAARLMLPFADVLVTVPGQGRPLYEPYIPFVGPAYRPGGVLVLATAQNLAQFGRTGDTPNWRLSTGLPDAPLHRLYRVGNRTVSRVLESAEVVCENVAMQPFEDGVLPALAGLWMAAAGEDPPRDLDAVAALISATNFYKHSLRTPSGADLNPEEPSFRNRLSAYRDLTLHTFAGPEVEILRPGAILAFRGVPEALRGHAPSGCRWRTINDPSWIKQGMSGVATAPSGSWFRRAQDPRIPMAIRDLVEAYLGQLRSPYSAGKREATRVYLLVNYLEFESSIE